MKDHLNTFPSSYQTLISNVYSLRYRLLKLVSLFNTLDIDCGGSFPVDPGTKSQQSFCKKNILSVNPIPWVLK